MIRFDLQPGSEGYSYVTPCMSFISFEEETPIMGISPIGDDDEEW